MDLTNFIDISMDLNENTLVWTADPQPELRPILRQPEDPVNFTWLDFSCHAGSHVDAPFFLFQDGWKSDEIPLERLMGDCVVVDLTDVEDTIKVEDFENKTLAERVLLKTQNSFDPLEKYNPEHVELSPEAAEFLLSAGVKTLGYDYQSFERDGRNVIHDIFLSHSVTIIDNLRLAKTEERTYTLVCLPIKLTGIDAAPCRALLFS